MKNLFIVLMMIIFASSMLAVEPIKATNKKREFFSIQVEGGLIIPQDNNFKDIYGSTQTLFGGRIRLNVIKKIYLFAGLYLTSKKAKLTIEDLSIDTESKQTFFSFGGGYLFGQKEKIQVYLEAAAVPMKIKEKAMEREVNESLFGFSVSTGFNKLFGRHLLTGLFIRYIYGSKEIYSRTVKPGGLFIAASFGFQI